MDNVSLYKQISLEIVDAIKNDEIDVLDELFDKRQSILDANYDKDDFKNSIIKSNIVEIDNNIKDLLSKEIEKTKTQIKEHRRSTAVNNCYIQNNKENLNIFNKKV